VGSHVWNDLNGNGIRQLSEPGVAGVRADLIDEQGTIISTATTDADGLYEFRPRSFFAVAADVTLRVRIEAPADTAFSPEGAGDNPLVNSDVDAITGQSEPFEFNFRNSPLVRHDAGLHGTSSVTEISGVAWDDRNGDGIRDEQETLRGGVAVQVHNATGLVVATTTTGEDGSYRFDQLAPAGYSISFVLPGEALASPMHRGDDATRDSDINRSTGRTPLFSLFTNQRVEAVDVGIFEGQLSGDVREHLRITEINPEMEFIELKNIGSEPLDLTGVRFIDGVAFDFTFADLHSLFPGERLVVVSDTQDFAQQYDTSTINVAGPYAGRLDDHGERIELVAPINRTILAFRYEPAWFTITKTGFSLTIRDDQMPPDLWSHRAAWRPSGRISGSPGRDDALRTPKPGAVVINEIMTNPANSKNDWIELLNTTDRPIDIGDWFLGDDADGVPDLTRYRIADGTVIPAGGRLTFTRDENFGNPQDPGVRRPFGLSSFGETLHLTAGDALGRLLGYSESIRFGGSDPDISFGRRVVRNREHYEADFTALDGPETLPDDQTQRFTFSVDQRPGEILDLNVTVVAGSTFGTVSATIISPQGTMVELAVSQDDNIRVVFDDEGTVFRPVFRGVVLPHVQPVGNLSDFDGEDPSGVWTLEVTGRGGGNHATLNLWSLDLEVGLPASDLVALQTPTQGSANAIPKADPVVINEIMYHPAFLGDEFLELHNITVDPVDVGGWQVDGIRAASGGDFLIPAGTTIPADGYLLIVPTAADAFRQQHAIDGSVPIVGPYTGSLDDAGETIRLFKFGEKERKILVDQVAYDNDAPWPAAANQGGGSLERVLPTRYGNDAENWRVTSVLGGTPGAANTVTSRVIGDLNLDGTIDLDDIEPLIEALADQRSYSVQYQVQPAWTGDTDGDGDFDFDDLPGFVHRIGGSVDARSSTSDGPWSASQSDTGSHQAGHRRVAEKRNAEEADQRQLATVWAPARDWIHRGSGR